MSIFRYCRGNSGIGPIRNSCLGCCRLCLQLAYIDCIFVSCTCCHIVNLAGFIHIHFAVNSNSSFFIQFYRWLTIRDGISLNINICQFSPISCIDFIFCCNRASRFNGAIGSANAYILADITKKKILLQTYFISLLPVLICFFYGNIATIDYFCMFPSFLLYSMELAAIDSICRGTRNFTSSHTTNFAALINGNLFVDCYSATFSHADRRWTIGHRFNTGQILIQIDSIIGMSIFRYCRGNGGIGSIRNSCLGCCRLTSDLL